MLHRVIHAHGSYLLTSQTRIHAPSAHDPKQHIGVYAHGYEVRLTVDAWRCWHGRTHVGRTSCVYACVCVCVRHTECVCVCVYVYCEQVLTADWCKYNDCLIATGSVDKTIKVWDVRQPGREMHLLVGHK